LNNLYIVSYIVIEIVIRIDIVVERDIGYKSLAILTPVEDLVYIIEGYMLVMKELEVGQSHSMTLSFIYFGYNYL